MMSYLYNVTSHWPKQDTRTFTILQGVSGQGFNSSAKALETYHERSNLYQNE